MWWRSGNQMISQNQTHFTLHTHTYNNTKARLVGRRVLGRRVLRGVWRQEKGQGGAGRRGGRAGQGLGFDLNACKPCRGGKHHPISIIITTQLRRG
jgi:hypothetical protein